MYSDSQRSDLRALEEVFAGPAANPKTQKLTYVILDCGVNRTVCDQHNITEVPEFKYLKEGRSYDFEWEWTAEGFYEIGHKLSNPPSYNLQRRQVFDNFKTKYDFSFMAWYFPLVPDQDHITKGELLGSLARDYWHRPFYFAQAAETSLRESEGIRFSELPLVKQCGNDEVFGFSITAFDENSLREFIEDHKWGLMPSLNMSLWKAVHKDCQSREKVLILVFHSASNYTHYSEYVNNLRLLYWDMRKHGDFRFQFASVDIDKYGDLVRTYGVREIPAIVAVDWSQNRSQVTHLTFDPASKLDTLKALWRLWDGETAPRPSLSPVLVSVAPLKPAQYLNWRHSLMASGMIFVWWGLKAVLLWRKKTV